MASNINSEISLSFAFVGERTSTFPKSKTPSGSIDLGLSSVELCFPEGGPITVHIPHAGYYDRWRRYSYPFSREGDNARGTSDLRISIRQIRTLVLRGNFFEFYSDRRERLPGKQTTYIPFEAPLIPDPSQRYCLVVREKHFHFTATLEKERVKRGSSRPVETAQEVARATQLLPSLVELVRDYALPPCSLPSYGLRQVGLDDLGRCGDGIWQDVRVLPEKMVYWVSQREVGYSLEFGPSATIQRFSFPQDVEVWCAALVAPGSFIALTSRKNRGKDHPLDVSEYHVLTAQASVTRPSRIRRVQIPSDRSSELIRFISGVEPHTGEVMFLNSEGDVFFRNEDGCYEEHLSLTGEVACIRPQTLHLATEQATTHIVALCIPPKDNTTYEIYVTEKGKAPAVRKERVCSRRAVSALSYPYLFTSCGRECLRWDIRTMECTVIFRDPEGAEVSALAVFDAYLVMGLWHDIYESTEIHFYDIAYDTMVGRSHSWQDMNHYCISVLGVSDNALLTKDSRGNALRHLFEPMAVKK